MANDLSPDAPLRNQPGKAVTEGQARRFFLRYRWPSGRKACPRCGAREVKEVRRHRLLCPDCQYEFGDFTGTYLARMRVGFKAWLELLQLFEMEWPAPQAARELGLSYPTVSRGFQIIRMAIAAQAHDRCSGSGAEGEGGARGGGAPGEGHRSHWVVGPVFGIREGSSRVHVEEVPALTSEELAGLKLRPLGRATVVYTSRFQDYDSLIFCLAGVPGGDSAPVSLNSRRRVHTLPGFLGYARERFAKLHGISRDKFPLHLRELEFRFNHREIVNSFTILAGYLIKPWQNLDYPANKLVPSVNNMGKDGRNLLLRP